MNKQALIKVRDCLEVTINSLQTARNGQPNGEAYSKLVQYENALHEQVKEVSRIINNLNMEAE